MTTHVLLFSSFTYCLSRCVCVCVRTFFVTTVEISYCTCTLLQIECMSFDNFTKQIFIFLFSFILCFYLTASRWEPMLNVCVNAAFGGAKKKRIDCKGSLFSFCFFTGCWFKWEIEMITKFRKCNEEHHQQQQITNKNWFNTKMKYKLRFQRW